MRLLLLILGEKEEVVICVVGSGEDSREWWAGLSESARSARSARSVSLPDCALAAGM
jgi:hypothetical protein